MKASIKPDTKKADALWLIVERGLDSPDVEKIMGMFCDEDESENVAYPILVDEVEKIRDACDEWLERESQNNMKENI